MRTIAPLPRAFEIAARVESAIIVERIEVIKKIWTWGTLIFYVIFLWRLFLPTSIINHARFVYFLLCTVAIGLIESSAQMVWPLSALLSMR